MRTLEIVQRELAAAEDDLSAIQDRVRRLRSERDELAIEASAHPWLGKAVKRTASVGHGMKSKRITNRGTVVAYNPKVHRRLRSLSTYNLNAGDPVVIHSGGNTGWRLNEYDWGSRAMKCDWELDDAQIPPSSGTQSPPPDNTDV